MRVTKNLGLSPRGRRYDRGKVAIAALAALLMFATSARAGIVDFEIDAVASQIKYTAVTDLTSAGVGKVTSTPQTNPDPGQQADNPHFYGHIYVNLDNTNGTIQLLPGSYISAITT